MENIVIDSVPYPVTIEANTYTIPNKWGVEGLDWVTRFGNRHGDPLGYVNDCKVYVERDQISITCNSEDDFLDVVRSIEYQYDSIEWELLEFDVE
jgi:hypothetical protein